MDTLFRIETDKLILSWSNVRKKETVPLFCSTPLPGKLLIAGQRSGLIFEKIWRAGPPGANTTGTEVEVGPHLFEQTDYKVFAKAKSGRKISILHRDPSISRSLSAEEGGRILYGVINFGSQIGLSKFSVIIDGKPEFDFQVEVFPTKLDYATDYQQILAEVQDIITGLALEYLRSTFQLGQEFKAPQPTHVEWLLLLRHVFSELERALHYIAQQPVRNLIRKPVRKRVEKIKSIDSTVRSSVRKGGSSGALINLERLGAGYVFKERIMAQQPRQTIDTPEHRWLAWQLLRLRQRISWLRRVESIQPKSERRGQVLSELNKLEVGLTRLTKLKPLAEASTELPVSNFASLQLLGAPGYREAYRCCIILSMGLRIEGGPIQLSVKDLSLLYEYWCYLALLRLISEELGCTIPVKELFAFKQQGIQVLLEKGREKSIQFSTADHRKITVSYNPRFQGKSIIIPQQPDLVITLDDPNWKRLHLILDAKYRVEASDKYLARYLLPGPPEDAINIMHRYRDAILESEITIPRDGQKPKRTVVQAAAVFPYREQKTGDFKSSLLWRSLDKIGVGALPALPGSMEYLKKWLNSFLHRGGWALADRAIEHRGREIARDWRLAAAESVLIGVLRSANEKQHLEWILDYNQYYMPLLKTQKRQFAAKWLALYIPKSINGQGSVAYCGPILGMEVIKRNKINTSWLSHNGDRMQVLYRLGPLKKLPQPILNKDAQGRVQRFSSHRWTSRLALGRAQTLPELLMETEPEWRLYEDLRAIGKNFILVPGKVALQDLDVPFGRVWFALEDGIRIRYTGASGYILKNINGLEKHFMRIEEVLNYVKAGFSVLQ